MAQTTNRNTLRIWDGKVPRVPLKVLSVQVVPQTIQAGKELNFIIEFNRSVSGFTVDDIDLMAGNQLTAWLTNPRLTHYPVAERVTVDDYDSINIDKLMAALKQAIYDLQGGGGVTLTQLTSAYDELRNLIQIKRQHPLPSPAVQTTTQGTTNLGRWKLTYDVSPDFDESALPENYHLSISIRAGSVQL